MDEPTALDRSLSSASERKGTIWGGEAGGVATGAAGGRVGCATCRAIAMQGVIRSNSGWKRGTTKSLWKKK